MSEQFVMTKKRWAIIAAIGLVMYPTGVLGADHPLGGIENFKKGKQYYEEGNFQGAADEFTEAFRLDRSWPFYQIWLAKVLIDNLKDYNKAIHLLEKVPNLEENADVQYWLGKAYANSGDPGKAIKYLKKSYEIDPDATTKALLDEMRFTAPISQEKGGSTGSLLRSLLPIFAITLLSVGALVALKFFVFQRSSVVEDTILFLVLVMIMVFSAAQLGIITGEQLRGIIDNILSIFHRT